MSTYTYDAFISYSHADSEAVGELVDRLKTNHGLKIFYDQHLAPGAGLPTELPQAIADCRAFVTILSESSVRSGWVEREYSLALACALQHKMPERVIPVLVGDVEVPAPLRDRLAVRTTRLLAEDTVTQIVRGVVADTNPRVLGTAQPNQLHEILASAQISVVIVGHTLKRILSNPDVRYSLERALQRGVKLTLVLQNPNSRLVDAYAYERILESVPEPHHEVQDALKQAEVWHGFLGSLAKGLRVILTNHMPSHRVIIVDDRSCYLSFYLFASDVSKNPIMHLNGNGEEHEQTWFRSFWNSVHRQINAADALDVIRDGVFDEHWKQRKIANFDSWDREAQRRHVLTWRFYLEEARKFRDRFGKLLEVYVDAYLCRFRDKRRILVLGCGSGKEIDQLFSAAPHAKIVGWDLSPVAIELAQQDLRDLIPSNRVSLFVENLYDLHLDSSGQFDGIVANAALVHLLKRDDLPELLATFYRKLEPGGLCFIRLLDKVGLKEQQEEEKGRFASARWFTYFGASELRQVAADAGFEHIEDADVEAADVNKTTYSQVRNQGFPHVQYADVTWPTVLLRKPEANRS